MTPQRALSLFLFFAAIAPAQQYRAYWADAFNRGFKTQTQADQMIEDAVASRANAIILQVRQRGNSFYLDSLEPLADDATWPAGFDPLRYLIERAKPKGIEIHAWFTITPVWLLPTPPRDPKHIFNLHGPSASGDNMWMTVGSTGRISPSYVDLGHPGVTAHTADVIMHVVKNYDIDGVHLDYIRYPEPVAGSGDHGYNPRALDRFNRQELLDGQPRSTDPRWTDFRRRQVTQFVRQLYLRVNEIKPRVKLSGALITWGQGPASDAEFRQRDAYTAVYQDWRSWLEEGILDVAIPMNYFGEARNGSFLDRWAEFEKDRQYRRMTLIGLGNYLSPIEGSVAQLRRALEPSRLGNRAAGVAFYSYSNTNLQDAAGRPIQPNADFYRQVGGLFGQDSSVPDLPWKSRPERGHLVGQLMVDDGAPWMIDGAGVTIESDTRPGAKQETSTDSTGYFGAVDVPPDRYFIRLWRNGQEFYRTPAREIAAGETVRFDVRLHRADLEPLLPSLDAAAAASAPANGIVRLSGVRLAGRVQAIVNGVTATVFRNAEDEVALILPNLDARQWRISVRQPGVESNAIELSAAAAAPEIVGVRRVGDVLEVYCVGLGRLNEATSRPVLPLEALINGQRAELLFGGGSPGQALFQVNLLLPAAMAAGTVQLRVGQFSSSVFAWQEPRQPQMGAVAQARSRAIVLANLRRLSLASFPRSRASQPLRDAATRRTPGRASAGTATSGAAN